MLYWFIQWLENNILVPLVMYHALGISPLMILMCMLLGASILGFL
ncbi:MAG: AI-2E family transporter [Candidatus Peribacteria bacterium]|nr:MAG: AI-2E family transporter [Candidatus Peribacteria bacterium]